MLIKQLTLSVDNKEKSNSLISFLFSFFWKLKIIISSKHNPLNSKLYGLKIIAQVHKDTN